MKILDWFGDPANKDKIQSIFRFLKDFWPVIAAGVIALMGPIPSFVAAIALAFGFVPKIIDFVKSIFGLNKDVDKEIKNQEKDYEKNTRGTAFDTDTEEKEQQVKPEETPPEQQDAEKMNKGGMVPDRGNVTKMNKGGEVPGQGNTDTVPAMLTPGEFVLTKDAVNQVGADTLYNMNAAAGGVGQIFAQWANSIGAKVIGTVGSNDKIEMLNAMGAKVYVCPANVSAEDPRSYYQVAKKLHKELKNSVYINQYFNDLNIEAHYKSTGPEIWEQTAGKITHLVACSGTGGTISGCAKYLKEQNAAIEIIGVDAYGSVLKKYHETRELDVNEIYPYRIEGLGKNMIPTATDFDVIDTFIKVTDEDSAYTARELTRSEGLFVGYTSGAAMKAVKQLNQSGLFHKESVVVIIFPDHGSRYMSKIFSDNWMNEQVFFENATQEQNKIIYI